jgi:hypothetical protein
MSDAVTVFFVVELLDRMVVHVVPNLPIRALRAFVTAPPPFLVKIAAQGWAKPT